MQRLDVSGAVQPLQESLGVKGLKYKFEVTVRIKLKRPNHNYPSCHLVGRHLTFPVTTTCYIPWVEFVFPSLRFGRLYLTK